MRRLLFALCCGAALAVATPSVRAEGPPAAIWLTDHGAIRFHADSTMQPIDARSDLATFVYDGKGGFVGSVALSSFEFTNGLLKSHFNEGYAETEKAGAAAPDGRPTYPNRLAVVSGQLTRPFDASKDTAGPVEVELQGRFTLHGVTLERAFRGTVSVHGGEMALAVRFEVDPKLHGMPVPSIGDAPMFKTVAVTVEGTLKRQGQ